MNEKSTPGSKPVLITFRFLSTAVLGSLIMALVYTFAGISDQIAVLGAYLSILGGLLLSYISQERERDRQRNLLLKRLALPLELARDSEVFKEYEEMTRNIAEALKYDDALFRELALQRLGAINDTIKTLAQGQIVYQGTETWRTAYEKLLRSPDISLYRSVALVETDGYWRDEPGKRSMELNLKLRRERKLNIERIAVISDTVWPDSEVLPRSPIAEWIEEQYNHGIWFELVRQSELANEPELIADIGIYGDKAIGRQVMDDSGRTSRFTLSFQREDVERSVQLWEKLKLYTVSYRKILDQQ